VIEAGQGAIRGGLAVSMCGGKIVVDFPSPLWYKCAMGAIHLKIDDGLRDKFKALCALKRSTMQRELIEFIRKEVLKQAARKK
jgi:hypothetical protein